MSHSNEDISDVLYLMGRSDFHNWYGKEEFDKYVIPPLEANQFIILRDEGRVPFVFASWAFPTHDQVSQYVKELEFMPEGYEGGGDIPWAIDFIAEGGKRNIALGFRKVKNVLSTKGYNQLFWLRAETQKLGFHQWG